MVDSVSSSEKHLKWGWGFYRTKMVGGGVSSEHFLSVSVKILT